MATDPDPIPLSALQHWRYCPRQCGLIHLEQVFDENVHTLRGQAVHAKVDKPGVETAKGVRVERAMPLWHDVLGLVGKADVVEFLPGGVPYPVEYKHGSRNKAADIAACDDIQLAAQALCLAHMLDKPVQEGALYYATSKRRRVVPITVALRDDVARTAQAIRQMLSCAVLPPVLPAEQAARRCKACSSRLEGGVSGNVLLRQAQFQRAADPAFALDVARACVAGKIKNTRQVLQRGAREAKQPDEAKVLGRLADDLAASLRALPAALNLDVLRGLEGEAARQYFSGLNLLVRPDRREVFQMDGRTRRPPRDRFNALLSFLYAMWMNDCRSALEAAGLDPQVGFLHALRPGRAALALDLMEEFRPWADRLALTLINRGQLEADDFALREGGGVLLEGNARKTVVVAYQERKRDEINHPLLAQPMALGLVPFVQARLLARALRDDAAPYVPFVPK